MTDKSTGNLLLIGLSISETESCVNSGTIPTYCMSFQGPQMLGFVHNLSIANPLKIVNNWFCSHLFVDPLKFQEHIDINVPSLRGKKGAFR